MRKILLTLLALSLLSGCSVTALTMKATKPLIQSTFIAVMDEPDLTIAKSAIESDLKLLDGVLEERPNDRELLTLSAMGFFAYSYAYVEEDSAARAVILYDRSKGYAVRGLITFGFDTTVLGRSVEEIEKELSKLPKGADPFVFWYALSSAMKIMQTLDKTASLADLPRAEAMMRRVRNRDFNVFLWRSAIILRGIAGI